MKLWVDAQLSPAIAIRDVGLQDAEDTVIFFSAPKMIWVTCGNTSNKSLRKILQANLRKAIELLEAGENLVEITG